MDYLDILKECYKDFMKTQEMITTFASFFYNHKDKVSGLFDILHELNTSRSDLHFEQLVCKCDESKVVFEVNDVSLVLSKEDARTLLTSTICILEEILPLGSVVDLNSDLMADMTSQVVENYRVVIIERFVYKKELKAYFEYVGVTYPIGKPKPEAQIQFTPSLIQRIVHHGFSDEQEEAFVKLIKAELVIEQKFKSIAFLNEQEQVIFQKLVKQGVQ